MEVPAIMLTQTAYIKSYKLKNCDLCCLILILFLIMWEAYTNFFIYFQVVGSESIEGEDQGTQITKFLEGYREGRTVKKTLSGPSLMQFIHRSFDIRMVYIFVFVVAVVILIQSLSKGDDSDEYRRVPNQDSKVNHPSSSISEGESKEYKEGDKED